MARHVQLIATAAISMWGHRQSSIGWDCRVASLLAMTGVRDEPGRTHAVVAAPSRAVDFDPTLLLWIVLAAALIFLVVNPLFRLVQLSLRGHRHRRLHADELRHRLQPPALPRRDLELAGARLLGHRAVPDLRRAGRLGGVAHRHAGQGRDPPAGAGRVRHAALSRFDRLDPARRSQRRLAEPRLDVAHRRAGRPVQHLFVRGPRLQHRALLVPVPVHLHLRGTRRGVIGNGGRGQHPGRRHAAHHAAHHPAAGAAGNPRRRHHHLPGGDRAVRHAGADRHPGALQRGHHAASAVLQPADPRRGGGGLRGAAAADHRGAVRRAALAGAPAGLRLAHRQGRRSAADRARTVALGDARLHDAAAVARGAAAVCRARPGGAGEGLGPRVQPRQSDAAQLPLPAVRARDRGAVGDQQLHLCRRGRLHRHGAGTVDRLHRQPPPAAVGRHT